MTRMQAMILHDEPGGRPNLLRIARMGRPPVGPNELLVRVRVCGVCRTDLHIVEGDLPQPRTPLIPGHQIVGIVEQCGDGVTRFQAGDRVGVAWLHETCQSCRFCLRGDENLCPSARFTGYDVHGGYAEYTVVNEAFAYPLPGGLSDERTAPLLCAGIIGYRALRLCGVRAGGTLGLYGFGASAHITLQVAVHQGIDVFVFSRSESHKRLAGALGASWCGSAGQAPPKRLDGSIVFAPAGEIVPHALEHLLPGGTCALAGICMSPTPPLEYERHLYHERCLRSVTAATRRDGTEFLETAAAIPVETRVTTFALGEANEALARLKAGRIDGACVLTVTDG